MPKFIDTELESESGSDAELDSKSELESDGQISHFADFEQVKNLVVILLSIF